MSATPTPTPHLPNEIWLHIIAHCEDNRDTWLSLRHINRQIQACVEQHFAENVLPDLKASLPMTMPSYDARNPIRGEAVFQYYQDQDRLDGTSHTVVFELGETGPQFYLAHFLGRWAGMKDVDGGRLRESVKWSLKLDEKVVTTSVKDVCALSEGVRDDEARIRLEWKPTLTAFYRG